MGVLMPRQSKGARLYLRLRGKNRTWVIRDGSKFYATGYSEGERKRAEHALRLYAAERGKAPYLGLPEHITARPNKLYFVTCEHPNFPIKIGIARDVEARVRGLRTALPYPIKILAVIDGDADTERALHLGF